MRQYLEKRRISRRAKMAADPAFHEQQKERAREWRVRNPDKVKASKQRERQKEKANPALTSARNRAYYAAHREKLKADEKCRRSDGRYLARARERRLENPDKHRIWREAGRIKNKIGIRLANIRKSAQQKGIAFDLDREWFETRLAAGVCEMSGLPLDDSKRGPNSWSVDRIDAKGPYTKANCRMILWWLNRALSNMGEEYAVKVFAAVIATRKKEHTALWDDVIGHGPPIVWADPDSDAAKFIFGL